MTPAAQFWCREQLLRQHPQWQLQEPFLPPSQRDAMLLLQGVLGAMLQIVLVASSSEVSMPRLGWWMDALQQLLQPGARRASAPAPGSIDHASLQHPALQCLSGSHQMGFLRAIVLTDWLHDLQLALAPQTLPDAVVLRHWCWRLARPWDWLDTWLTDATGLPALLAAQEDTRTDRLAASSVHARRLLLQQINTLPQRNWLYHNLPMTLRARHQLQLDAWPAAQSTPVGSPQQPPWHCPGALLADLLALDAELASGIDAAMHDMPPALRHRSRFWQAGNRNLARSLRKRISGGHQQPCHGISVALAWSCWRSARAGRRVAAQPG